MQKKVLYSYRNPRINSLVFKLTDYCNLGCNYCYRGNNKEKPKDVMDDNLIYNVIEKYIIFKKQKGFMDYPANLIWHGGEPLLAGLDKFKKIIEIENYFKSKENITFVNAVQTNGTLITEEWANFLKENNFLVGFSIDGPKLVHDIHRYNKSKKSSFNDTLKGVNILKNYNLKLNTISVITNESIQYVEQIYNFVKTLGINTIDFIPCFYYEDPMTVSPQNYTTFMLRMLELWKSDCYKPIKIRFLNDVFRRVIHRDSKKPMHVGCGLAGSCGENFSVGVKGDIYPCECLTPIKSFELGNIMNSSFIELLETDKFNEFKGLFNDVSDECFECGILDLCRGGCLNRRLKMHNLNSGKDFYCDSRKKIIESVINMVENEEDYLYAQN